MVLHLVTSRMGSYIVIAASCMVFALALGRLAQAAPPACMFLFGDSLVDSGNNKLILPLATANFKPYGIDYPGHMPTGRFCNGRIVSDFLSEYWGMEPVLPFLDPNATGQNLLRGANFASGGSGILNDTGNLLFMNRISMNQQIQLYRDYIGNLTNLIGAPGAAQLLSQGLHSFTTGTNDLITYQSPVSRIIWNPLKLPQFEHSVISQYRKQLKIVYGLGARKILVAGLGPLGCIPTVIAQRALLSNGAANGDCVEWAQQAAVSFNRGLKAMVEELRLELPAATLLYFNSFDIVLDMVKNPAPYGFSMYNTGCCGLGPYRGIIPCNPTTPLCSNRSIYVFWDAFHPTEAANEIISERLLHGTPSDISPINLSQLFPL